MHNRTRHVVRRAGLLLALVMAPAAWADEVPALGEAEFVTRVERQHPRLPVLASRIAAARAEIEAARVLPNPLLSYEREDVSADGRRLPEDFVRAGIPLDLSGRRGRRIAAAE